jgi:hypothetical protein
LLDPAAVPEFLGSRCESITAAVLLIEEIEPEAIGTAGALAAIAVDDSEAGESTD